jgi:ammonium transporter, Amt family
MPAGAFPGKTVVDESAKTVAFDLTSQVTIQTIAALGSAVYAFVVTAILVLLIDKTIGFTVKPKDEEVGLDLTQHGEIGLDVGQIEEELAVPEPKAAAKPPAKFNGHSDRFTVVLDGADPKEVQHMWSELCKPTDKPPRPEFVTVYKHLTTMTGNKFKFRGGDPKDIKKCLEKLFEDGLDASVKSHVEH